MDKLTNNTIGSNIQKGNYRLFYGGPYSQWADSEFNAFGIKFNTAEQFMMLGKAVTSCNSEFAHKIMATQSPSEQKKLGRQIPNFDQLVWDTYKYPIVLLGNFLKFTQCSNLNNYIVNIEDATVELFVEASPTDTIWGIGLSEMDAYNTTPDQWKGTNLLGQVITDIRDLLVYGDSRNGSTFEMFNTGYSIMESYLKKCELI